MVFWRVCFALLPFPQREGAQFFPVVPVPSLSPLWKASLQPFSVYSPKPSWIQVPIFFSGRCRLSWRVVLNDPGQAENLVYDPSSREPDFVYYLKIFCLMMMLTSFCRSCRTLSSFSLY